MELDINRLLGYNINRVAILMRGELIKCFREYKISPEQWIALVILWQRDSISQTEIAAITLQNLPAVSNMIKRMVKNGYVTKERDATSDRTTIINLTPKGRQLEKILPAKWEEHAKNIWKNFPKSKRKELNDLLIEYRKIMGDLF